MKAERKEISVVKAAKEASSRNEAAAPRRINRRG